MGKPPFMDTDWEKTLEVVIRRIVRQELRPQLGPLALPTAAAAKRMGIGLTRLRELLRAGGVRSCEGSSRLIPVSEIERWTAPRASTGSASTRRRQPGRRSRMSDRKSEADRIRELERVAPDLPEGDH